MLHGLWKLTWLEIKIFLREPLGVVGTIVVPVIVFTLLGRALGARAMIASPAVAVVHVNLPVLMSLVITLSAVLSLVTIISIYRESGILKRLRATPLRSHTILVAHVIVKLLLTSFTLALMIAVGRPYYPISLEGRFVSFTIALLFSTVSILSIGFVIASLVPTARFAQPVGTIILYPMLALSGLFVPLKSLPPALQVTARMLPLTYAVSLLEGIWNGDGWLSHLHDVGALMVIFAACTAVSARVFRWE